MSRRQGVHVSKKVNVGALHGEQQEGPRITVEVRVWWPEGQGHELKAFDVLRDAAMEALQQIRRAPSHPSHAEPNMSH